MKKTMLSIAAVAMALVMAMPMVVLAQPTEPEQAEEVVEVVLDESTIRLVDGEMFAALRYFAYLMGAQAEWSDELSAALITGADGVTHVIVIADVGGFIDDGIAFVPVDFINEELAPLLFQFFTQTAPRVDPINPMLWDVENFADVREATYSTDLPVGEIAVNYIRYMSNNLPGRSAFTYSELEAAIWIVEELLAMGYDFTDITVQEFSYWDYQDLELVGFMPLSWFSVTHPMVLGVDRDHLLREDRLTQNVILTVPGQSGQTIIVGAHYDSPPYASASDNASGVALLLESAQRMLLEDNYYTIVYVFFGAEEVGLVGAYYFLESLSQAQRDNIVMMVNADVIIEGPYVMYGASALPQLTDAEFDLLVEELTESMATSVEDIIESILQDPEFLEMLGLADIEDEEDVVEALREMISFEPVDISTIPQEVVIAQAAMSGLLEPYVNEIAASVSAIAAQLSEEHDFMLLSFPELAMFPTDSLVFFFDGFTVVNFVGLERTENVSEELAAQLTRLGEGIDEFTVTILHTPLDEFYFIEEMWPGMMNDNLYAFVVFLQAILLGSFS